MAPNVLTGKCLRIDAESSARYATVVFNRGDVLRKWREERGWTAKDLIARTGLDKNTISRAESGDSTLRESTIATIVAALGRSTAELHLCAAWYAQRPTRAWMNLVDAVNQLPDEALDLLHAWTDQATALRDAQMAQQSPSTPPAAAESPAGRSSGRESGRSRAANTSRRVTQRR